MPTRGIVRVRKERKLGLYNSAMRKTFETQPETSAAVVSGKRQVTINGSKMPAVELDVERGTVISVKNIGRPGNALYAPADGRVTAASLYGGYGSGGSGGGTTDHGALSGLGDDDHGQYVHASIPRTISAVHTFAPGSGVPFILGVGTHGNTVVGLRADAVAKTLDMDQTMVTNSGSFSAYDNEDPITIKVNQAGSYVWTGAHSFSPGVQAPFTIGAGSYGLVVAGLKAAAVNKSLEMDGTMVANVGSLSDYANTNPIPIKVNVANDFAGALKWTGTHEFSKPLRTVHSVVFENLELSTDPDLPAPNPPIGHIYADGHVFYDRNISDSEIGGQGYLASDESRGGLLLYDYDNTRFSLLLSTANMDQLRVKFNRVDTRHLTNEDAGVPDLRIDSPLGVVWTPNEQTWRTETASITPERIEGLRFFENDAANSSTKLEVTEIEATRMRVHFLTFDQMRVTMGQLLMSHGYGIVAEESPAFDSIGTYRWVTFEAIPELGATVPIFTVGDFLRFAVFKWTATGGFIYDGEVWFRVAQLVSQDVDNNKQVWNIRRWYGGWDGMVLPASTACINYGQEQGGRIWLNSLYEKEGPFLQMGHYLMPSVPTLGVDTPATYMDEHVRVGNLSGIIGNANGEAYGLAAAVDITALTETFRGIVVQTKVDPGAPVGDSGIKVYNADINAYSNGAWHSKMTRFGDLILGENVDASNGISFLHAGISRSDVNGVLGKNVDQGDFFAGDWLTNGNYVHFDKSTGLLTVRGVLQVQSGSPVTSIVETITGVSPAANPAASPFAIKSGVGNEHVVAWPDLRIRTSAGGDFTLSAGELDTYALAWPRVIYIDVEAWRNAGAPSTIDVTGSYAGIQAGVQGLSANKKALAYITSGEFGPSIAETWGGRTSITGDWIRTGTVTADHLNAEIVLAQKYIELSTGANIRTAGKTMYNSSVAGVFLGYDSVLGAHAFGAGDANSYIRWNGTQVSIRGSIEVTSGQVFNDINGLSAVADSHTLQIATLGSAVNDLDDEVDSLASQAEQVIAVHVYGDVGAAPWSAGGSATLSWTRLVVRTSANRYFYVAAGSRAIGSGRFIFVNLSAWDAAGGTIQNGGVDWGFDDNIVGIASQSAIASVAGRRPVAWVQPGTTSLNIQNMLGNTLITGDWIATGSVFAGNIAAGQITGDKLVANVALVNQGISVGSDLAASGYIRSYNKTSYGNSNGGFWLGRYTDGTYRFDVGDGTNYLRWSGTAINIATNQPISISQTNDSGVSINFSNAAISGNVGVLKYVSTQVNAQSVVGSFSINRNLVANGASVSISGFLGVYASAIQASASLRAGKGLEVGYAAAPGDEAVLAVPMRSSYAGGPSFVDFAESFLSLTSGWQTNWENWSGGGGLPTSPSPTLMRMGDIVVLNLGAQRDNVFGRTDIIQLPAGYRPPRSLEFPCSIIGASGGPKASYCIINSSGMLRMGPDVDPGNTLWGVMIHAVYSTKP